MLLLPYYCILYLMRDKLKRRFIFTLKRITRTNYARLASRKRDDTVLSGHPTACRQSESGGGGLAAAERNGTGGTQTSQERGTDREAERRSHDRSDQHSRKRGFSFRRWKDESLGTQERGFARPHP